MHAPVAVVPILVIEMIWYSKLPKHPFRGLILAQCPQAGLFLMASYRYAFLQLHFFCFFLFLMSPNLSELKKQSWITPCQKVSINSKQLEFNSEKLN